MGNSTQFLSFTLAAYVDTGVMTYLLFLLVLSLYMFILVFNVLLIVVILFNRSLHEPMYLFLCSLFVNELYGSTGLFPFLLLHILSDVHTISAPFCFLQIFSVYSYGSVELFTLAAMSYDRYLAVCFPLDYNSLMTFNRLAVCIILVWLTPFLVNFLTLPLFVAIPRCGNVIYKVYCDYYSVLKLACSDTTSVNVYGLSVSALLVFAPLLLIFYTYMRILQVCFSGSKQTRRKAISTCTPHLASLLNFTVGACFEIVQSRFNMKNTPNIMRIFLSLYFLTCPPLFNPIMYGLQLSKISVSCQKLLSTTSHMLIWNKRL